MIRRPRYQDSGGSRLLLVTEILLMAGAFYASAVIDRAIDPSVYFLYEGGLGRVVFACLTILAGLYFLHLYSEVRVVSRVRLLQQLCEVFGIALVAQSVVIYIRPSWILPRWLMINGAMISLVAMFLWRVFYSEFVLNIVRRQRLLFVGQNATIADIVREIANSPERGYEVVGFIDDCEIDSKVGKWLGPINAVATLARKIRPNRIVVGVEDRAGVALLNDLLDLHYERFAIDEASQTYESVNQRLSMRDFDPIDLIFSKELTPAPNHLSVQKWIDRFVAGFMLTALLPVAVTIAIGLRLRSKAPVLIGIAQVGYHGKVFNQIRFRPPASQRSIYRRLHLDALPELLNVVRGEMALVGPRAANPALEVERKAQMPLWEYRYNVRPGMTGWAQVNLLPWDQERNPALALSYDLYYVKQMSQTFNVYILMTTLKNRVIWSDQENSV
jgi:lipopolysaccharide/colanic/teichoic acid biosynthesis glycosyltransferase